ncbi:MAG: DUF309 domain-containing protein [Planctomycetota bacterium]|nr:MAG: DUF309 domain-containing protein [Planctomycetota bacterium]
MPRIEPEEQDFDPEEFSEADAERAFAEGVRLFNAGDYHAAHEALEQCWLATEGADSDLFKGLIQAAICMYHFRRANLAGARKLYSGHRKLLGPYLPERRGLDLDGFLAAMQRTMRPVLRARADEDVSFELEERPILRLIPRPGSGGSPQPRASGSL